MNISALYEEIDYLSAYRLHTDIRVEKNPHEAAGGLWETMGLHQFNYLRVNGLQSAHRMLDLGCGTLRGGRHFIAYLDAGHYLGIDISPKAIEYAKTLAETEGLTAKQPKLSHTTIDQVQGSFDVILAQSVFTHLPPAHIERCFGEINRLMTCAGRFFFTFFKADRPDRFTFKDFGYPFSFFADLGERHKLRVECRSDYAHPRNQIMAVATF